MSSAAAVKSARTGYESKADAFAADGVRPRDLDAAELAAPLGEIARRVAQSAEALAECGLTEAHAQAAQELGHDYLKAAAEFPTDLRAMRRRPQGAPRAPRRGNRHRHELPRLSPPARARA